MPTLQLISLLSRRLIWPAFRTEPYLEISDLERAIELSSADTPLIEQERATLRNIVMLSDIRGRRMDATANSVCHLSTARVAGRPARRDDAQRLSAGHGGRRRGCASAPSI